MNRQSEGLNPTDDVKIDVVGTGVSARSLLEVVDSILNPPADGQYVAIANVHSLMMSRSSDDLSKAMSNADIVTPDGMPLVWALKALGRPDQERVHGMAVVDACLARGQSAGARHYFYGSSRETLDQMRSNMVDGVDVVGYHSPPFRTLTDEEVDEDVARIVATGPTVVWVGLGAPKQELWMAKMHPRLPGVSLVGVGAVFDWLAGNVTKAPEWMQKAGLEWLYRLAKEPRRLWRRYVWNNPAYLALLGLQILRSRISRARGTSPK